MIFTRNMTGEDAKFLKSALAQIVAWCHQATSQNLTQCWPMLLRPYSVNPQFSWCSHHWNHDQWYKIVIIKNKWVKHEFYGKITVFLQVGWKIIMSDKLQTLPDIFLSVIPCSKKVRNGCVSVQVFQGLMNIGTLSKKVRSGCVSVQIFQGLMNIGTLSKKVRNGCVSVQVFQGLMNIGTLSKKVRNGCVSVQVFQGLMNIGTLSKKVRNGCVSGLYYLHQD